MGDGGAAGYLNEEPHPVYCAKRVGPPDVSSRPRLAFCFLGWARSAGSRRGPADGSRGPTQPRKISGGAQPAPAQELLGPSQWLKFSGGAWPAPAQVGRGPADGE